MENIEDFQFDLLDEHFLEAFLSEDNENDEIIPQSDSNVSGRRFKTVDVDQFLKENVNKNTVKKTESDLKVFQQFLSQREEYRNIQFIPPEKLNEYICEFLLSVTRRNGEEYEPTSLRSFVSSIDRHLKLSGSKISILNDLSFAKCRDVLKSKQKALKKQGLGNKPKAAEALSDEHLEKFYEARTLGDYTPRSLIHSMWFVCATYFGMRTGTEIHNLKWGDINIGLDEGSGREYLQLCTERQTKTRTGVNARDIR